MAALRISVLWLWNLRKAEQGLLTSDVDLLLRELLYSIVEDLVVREVVVKAEFILRSDYSNYMTIKYILYIMVSKNKTSPENWGQIENQQL